MTEVKQHINNSVSVKESLWRNRRFVYCRSVVFHLVLFLFVYWLSFVIKYDCAVDKIKEYFVDSVVWILLVKTAVLIIRGSHKDLGHYASVAVLRGIITESCITFAFIAAFFSIGASHFFQVFDFHLPLSILVIDMILSILFRGGGRMAMRIYRESVLPSLESEEEDQPALLVCANARSAYIANSINSQRNIGYHVVGFLTIHDYKVKMQLSDLPVVAKTDDFVPVARKMGVKTILFVAGSLPGKKFREMYEECEKNGLILQVVPQVEFYPDTKIPIRDIDINDLLKRDPIKLDDDQIKSLIAGRKVMVTGAGGSIGSEICRQIMRFEPKELYLLGRGENRIFFLERELKALKKATKLTPIIADVSNASRIDGVFSQCRPEIVFHAAAHKHVPLMEANIPEAIRNNIYGTKVVADASDRYGVAKFVMVSTDKAVNPSSVMGCSKQMAERYVNSLAVHSKTRFIVTRFGNVLGSNGSVVPIFTKQIQQGGPITITDKRMTRFFMTIPEAAQLVLEAAAMGKGGEIFVLDMGDSVKIMDLAKDLIRLAGLPEHAIEIQEVGLRPGEKLYEELFFETEKQIPTTQKKLFVAEHRQFELKEVQAQIDELLDMTTGSQEAIRDRLRDFVPEYKPTILK